MHVKDQLNREILLSEPPRRIISLVPSQTELLVDLGLKDLLVGVTKFCVHPKGLKKDVMIVGGTKQVNMEKIQAVAPDLIICNKEENTLAMVQELEQIARVYISDVKTFEDSLDLIRRLGSLFSVEGVALKLNDQITDEMMSFQYSMREMEWVKVAYVIWKDPYMIAGRDCFINEMLRFNKFENILKDPDSRYPEVDLDDLSQADLILLSSEPYPFKISDVDQMGKLLQKKVRLVDGTYFSWYGSRLREAFTYFKNLQNSLYTSTRE